MPATSRAHHSVVKRVNSGIRMRLKITEALQVSACLGEYSRGSERTGHDFVNIDPALGV
jgi:hypothetical protein